MTNQTDLNAALLTEGDRLARTLAQTLSARLTDQTRLTFLGRSLAMNLVNAFLPTVEQISRHAGKPLHAHLTLDDRDRPVIQTVNLDGEVLNTLPADDLTHSLLYTNGRLHPVVLQHLHDGLSGDEHHATRALVHCLRSKSVLDAMSREVKRLMKSAEE